MRGPTASPNSAFDRVLLGDIGGTNCRLGIFDPSVRKFVERIVYSTDDFRSPREAISVFLGKSREPRPRIAALALACPVVSDTPRLTNTGWSFDRGDLVERFQLEKLVFVNDLVAQARGLCEVPAEAFKAVGLPMLASPASPAAIVGAGTGLGIARIDSFEEGRVASSEGGHIGFSPGDDVEMELLRLWRRHLGRVTNEHVISGPGIVRLYRALGAVTGTHVEPIDGPEIVRRAVEGSDAFCVETAERFAKILGSITGDACLAFCASTAVLVGTITNALAPIIQRGGFRARFEQRGPGGAFLKSAPTLIAAEPDLGLLGAYAFLAAQPTRLESAI